MPAATQTKLTLGPVAVTRIPGASAPVDVRIGRHLFVTAAYSIGPEAPGYVAHVGLGRHQVEWGLRGRGWVLAHMTDDRFGEVKPIHKWAVGGWRRLADVLSS